MVDGSGDAPESQGEAVTASGAREGGWGDIGTEGGTFRRLGSQDSSPPDPVSLELCPSHGTAPQGAPSLMKQ